MIEAIQFSSFSEFLNMGGYAFNVWSVYALFIVFVLVNLLVPLYKKRHIIEALRRRAVIAGETSNPRVASAGLESPGDIGEIQ
ncbi:MAG: heme exporter protein CcmD [Pseudohongiellaceae bacterium]